MRYAIVQDGKVVNIVEASPRVAEANGWADLPDGAGIGDTYADGQFTRAVADNVPTFEPVPRHVAKMAAIQIGLWPALVAYLDRIKDPTQRAMAEIALHESPMWFRDMVFLADAAQVMGVSPGTLDELFNVAATIEV